MTIDEIREWREQNIEALVLVEGFGLSTAIDTLLAALDEKEERLAIKDDALCAATMVGEFAISKLKVATAALESIRKFKNPEDGKHYSRHMREIAAAALKGIGGNNVHEQVG